MANSALFSQKSATFEPQSAGGNSISILLHEGGVSDNIAAVVKSGTSTIKTIDVETTSQPAGAIEYSLNNAAYQQAVSSPVGTVNSFQITVPIGTHTLKCRLSENGAESQTVNIIASRFVILGSGQSNMRGTGADLANPVTSQSGHTSWLLRNSDNLSGMRSEWDVGTNQVDMVSYDGYAGHAWMIRYANRIVSEYDEPVICIPSALGGSTISQHVKNSGYESNGVNMYASSVRRANLIGGVTLHIYQQSENDAVDSTGTVNKSYQSSLDGMINDYYADLGVPTLIMPLHTISRSNYSGTGGASLDDSGQDALRSAQIAVAASNQHAHIAAPLTSIDLSSGDDIHFSTNDELNTVADIAFNATKQILGEVSKSASFSGAGLAYGDVGTLSLLTDVAPQTYITWAQVNNGAPTVTIANPHAATTTFTAPSEDANIIIAAHVSDGDYVALDQQTFTVSAAQVPNQPPTANAGPDQSVAAGARVQLNASMSSDPEDGSVSQFGWEQVDNGAATVVLEFANTATPEFTAPSSLTAQTLEFRVQAQDSEGATATDTVTVQVAALQENEILSTMETLDFELVTQGNLVAYKGRSNREVMQLKPSSLTGIVTAGGYLDLSQNGIAKVEIIADGKKISNEDSDSIKIDGARILARLGDLDIPTSGRDSITPTFMIVLYVGSDTRGLVVASNATSGYKPLSYRVEDAA